MVFLSLAIALQYHLEPLLLRWIKFNPSMDIPTYIPAWIYIHYKVWNEIIHPFQTSTVQLMKFGNE